MPILRMATRASRLAEAQTRQVAARLERLHRAAGLRVELVFVRTAGDRDRKTALQAFGAVGVFVKELEEALRSGRADCAVHSLKDVPLKQPRGLVLAALLQRADARDALVSRAGGSLRSLPAGALIGTGSPRRRVQLADARPDLRFTEIRGNVDTRARKVREGVCDATLLAWAGLKRAGLTECAGAILPFSVMLPAPGQGALAVECRAGDRRTRALLAPLADWPTTVCVAAERAALGALGGGCKVPLGAYADFPPAKMKLRLRLALGHEAEGRLSRVEVEAELPIKMKPTAAEIRRLISVAVKLGQAGAARLIK